MYLDVGACSSYIADGAFGQFSFSLDGYRLADRVTRTPPVTKEDELNEARNGAVIRRF